MIKSGKIYDKNDTINLNKTDKTKYEHLRHIARPTKALYAHAFVHGPLPSGE